MHCVTGSHTEVGTLKVTGGEIACKNPAVIVKSHIDGASKWIATADSKVTILGSANVAQIDAPKGVTINSVAKESGTYTLASGGTLILKTS
jgi:hypothetical protein